ncbi:MAG: inositol monophosphatase [Bacteroidetes bacterium]|nr:inositol monophosphatase [Bacteroidota bacterium]
MKTLQQLPDSILSRLEPVFAYQLSSFRKDAGSKGYLKNPNESVSEIDITSERMIRDILHSIIPEATFFGEETEQSRSDQLTWVVDPIDGTANYLNGIDFWSVSIALLENHSPVASCIVRPVNRETFTAVKGVGAFLNGNKLPTVKISKISNALIGTGMPYRTPESKDAFFPCASEVLNICRDIRRMGSAAIDLAYVGANFLQGFWEIDLQPYDVAAALLIMEETGCIYTDAVGEKYDMFSSRTCTAGHPGVHEKLISLTGKHYQNFV